MDEQGFKANFHLFLRKKVLIDDAMQIVSRHTYKYFQDPRCLKYQTDENCS